MEEHRKYKKDILKYAKCINYLMAIAKDYQFDKSHDDYCGFINVDPSLDLLENENQFLIDNIEKFNIIMNLIGRKIESASSDELILAELK